MKILASDFDGTLNRGGVSEFDREAVARWRSGGNLFGIVTGRDFNGIWHEIRKHGIELDFVAPYNGGVIFDADGETVLCETFTSARLAGDLIEYLKSVGAGYAELCVLKTKYQVFPDRDDRPLRLTDEILRSLDKVTMINTYISPFEKAVECAAVMKERFGECFNPLLNGCCIDIPPAGMDKGVGVKNYAEYVSVKTGAVFGVKDIITVGDQLNDMAMIEHDEFFGCAIENAVPELKTVAKAVYKSVGELIYDNL